MERNATISTVMAISEFQNEQGIEVDMIDTLVGSTELNHTMVPSRLFKKTVQQGRSE